MAAAIGRDDFTLKYATLAEAKTQQFPGSWKEVENS